MGILPPNPPPISVGMYAEGALRTIPDVQPAVHVPEGRARVGLDVALVHGRRVELPLHYDVRFGEPLLHVSHLEAEMAGDVARHFRLLAELVGEQVVVEQGGVRLHGVVQGHNRGQFFVIHLYQGGRLIGGVQVKGGHRSHGVALVEDLVCGQDVVTLELQVIVTVSQLISRKGGEGEVLAGYHRLDSRERLGRAGVDGLYPGVGVGASQHGSLKQTSQLHIGAVLGTPGNLVDAVRTDGPCPNNVEVHLG